MFVEKSIDYENFEPTPEQIKKAEAFGTEIYNHFLYQFTDEELAGAVRYIWKNIADKYPDQPPIKKILICDSPHMIDLFGVIVLAHEKHEPKQPELRRYQELLKRCPVYDGVPRELYEKYVQECFDQLGPWVAKDGFDRELAMKAVGYMCAAEEYGPYTGDDDTAEKPTNLWMFDEDQHELTRLTRSLCEQYIFRLPCDAFEGHLIHMITGFAGAPAEILRNMLIISVVITYSQIFSDAAYPIVSRRPVRKDMIDGQQVVVYRNGMTTEYKVIQPDGD